MIEIKKILLPTDFSDTSKEALKYAVSLAGEYGARLTVLHVINRQLLTEGLNLPRVISMEELETEMKKEAARQMAAFLKEAREAEGIKPLTVILDGVPAAEITRYAKDEDVDLIVIGTHGRGAIEHMLFGGTAEKVVRKAPCPVLLVKPAQREFITP